MPTSSRSPRRRRGAPEIAFVLGGGGQLGAHEVGMLRALTEAGIRPDVILGTSIGALNGALFAARPTPEGIAELTELWDGVEARNLLGGSVLKRLGRLAVSGTHAHPNAPLRKLLADRIPVQRLEDLTIPFQCVAASIERASEHWFITGPVVEAVLASCALPGVLPPVAIEGEHFLDGGIVNSIPVGRAVALGARTIYVLQVGRIEVPLTPPRRPWEVGLVAFEIARRHRFMGDMERVPQGVAVHVLPTGLGRNAPRYNDLRQLRYSDLSRVRERIERAYRASRRYLQRTATGASG